MSLMNKSAIFLGEKLRQATDGDDNKELVYIYFFEKLVNYIIFYIILSGILIYISTITNENINNVIFALLVYIFISLIMLINNIFHYSGFLFVIIYLMFFTKNIDITAIILITYRITTSLRSRFGGMHVKSDYLCLIITLISTLMNGWIAFVLKLDYRLIIINYIITILIVRSNEVVDNENKRLSEKKKTYFKKQGYILLIILMMINTVFYSNIINNAIFISLVVNNINILFGNRLNKIGGRK